MEAVRIKRISSLLLTLLGRQGSLELSGKGSLVLVSLVAPLGVKADAVPGRINQVKFICQRPGIFFGQCSEICGANHRFIPPDKFFTREVKSFVNFVRPGGHDARVLPYTERAEELKCRN